MIRCKHALLGLISALFLGSSLAQAAPSTYVYTGGTYTQDFDRLPVPTANSSQIFTPPDTVFNLTQVNGQDTNRTPLDGWEFVNSGGSDNHTEFRSQDGSQVGSAGRGVLSLGVNNSSDRALGALPTSAEIPAFGLVLQNNTGGTLDTLTLSYTGEQWHRGDAGTHDTLTFAYGLGTDINSSLSDYSPLSFNAPNVNDTTTNVALDGNAAANQSAISGTLTGLNWTPGSPLILRWKIANLMNNDDALAIDSLSLTATPEPSAAVLVACGIVALVGGASFQRVRRTRCGVN